MPFGLQVAVFVIAVLGGLPAMAGPAAARQDEALPVDKILVGGVPLTVEIAADLASTTRGLGGREGLAPDTGMLFVFDRPQLLSFWMKGMLFCLDIIWIEGGAIQGAAENVCPAPPGTADADLTPYTAPAPVTYALEVPAGWLAAHGLGAGAPVEGLPTAVGT